MQPNSVRFLRRDSPPHMATLILLTGLSAMAMNIFLPSLPGMAAYFETDYRVLQLSVALYLGVNAIFQLIVGPLADKMGRRPVILWGVIIFLLATLGCIFAPNAEVFLIMRMCQATVAVATVLSRAAVRDMFSQDQAASVLGYVTMGMAIVPMISPMIGGALDTAFGWTASFWLLLVLGVLAVWLIFQDFGETAHKSGLTLIQQFREYPELLTSPRFWGYSLASGLSSGAFFAYLGGGPFVGSEVYGLNTAELGFYFGAPAVGYFFGNFMSGRYSTRFGVNRMVLWGNLIGGLGVSVSLLVTLSGLDTVYSFFGLLTLVGVGNGMSIPNATAGSMSVRPHLAATASGLSGAIMLGVGAFLSGLAGAKLTPGSTALPLLIIMLVTVILGIVAILMVIRREKQLGL